MVIVVGFWLMKSKNLPTYFVTLSFGKSGSYAMLKNDHVPYTVILQILKQNLQS